MSCSRLGAFLAAAALLFAGATGCGDSTDTSPTPGDEPTESSAAEDTEQDEFVQAMHAEGIECDPAPVPEDGDPTCGDFNDDWVECKIDEEPEDGTYTSGDFSGEDDEPAAPECDELIIDISNASSSEFDWESNLGVDAVFVKGGPGGNLYECEMPSTLGHDFTADRPSGDFGISHVSFCFEPVPDVKVTKEAAEDPINVGDDAAFDITIESIGTVDAENVTLEDVLADTGDDEDVNWQIDSVTKNGEGDLSNQCDIDDPDDGEPDDVLTCDFDDPLAPGDTIEVSVSRTTTSD
ncbi:MAG: hypothetical protein ACOC9J_03290, partial [Persicimonas sp.]